MVKKKRHRTIDPAKARAVFSSLIQRYPQSRWRAAAENLIRLIDEGEAARETDRKARLLAEQLLTERARALQENEQLKSQVAGLQKENLALKGEMTTFKADAEAMKKQFEELTKQKQALEEQVKEAEAKIAARPGTKPPLKPKKSS